VKGRLPEVLAPAGDRAALEAAVRAGADAVYFGLTAYSARARATNFDAGALGETMRALHGHGVKGYVTLNTLVFDAELPAVEAAIRACAAAGVDAIIVQDLGLLRLARAVAPELPVHASTQMTCTDVASVELARSLGASRVILARELSLREIAAVRRATDVELEVFVHGALCISYSGQCLTSEAIGGRSANRGACAQACRLPYELVVDGVRRDPGDAAYLLSPEDLEASALVPDLVALGVAGLKIEGRLKDATYVGATTALFRKAVDATTGAAPGPTDDDRERALAAFTRGSGPGFLAGVDHQRLVEGRSCDHRGLPVGEARGVRLVRGRRVVDVELTAALARGDGILVEGGFAGEGEIGGRVWALHEGDRDASKSPTGGEAARAEAGTRALVWLGPDKAVGEIVPGRRVFRTSDPARAREVARRLADEPFAVALDVVIRGALGEPPVFAAESARGQRAEVRGDAPLQAARGEPLGEAVLRDKLGRLGGSPFVLRALRCELPADAMVPVSSLNRARRALVEALTAAPHAHRTTSTSHRDLLASATPPDRAPPPAGLFVLCRNAAQAEAAADAGADGIVLDFLDLAGTTAALRALRAHPRRPPVTLAPPRIRKPGEDKIDKNLAALAPDALLVRSLGALAEVARSARGDAPPCFGDFSLNVTNTLAAAEVLARGLAGFTPAFDLDAAQLAALTATPFGPFAEVVVHHPVPLFHMEHCVIAALLSDGKDHETCGRPCDRHQLSLRDRTGMDHPVLADVGCRNTVFHAAAQSAAELVPTLQGSGVRRFRIELVRETPDEVHRLVGQYRALLEGRKPPREVWKALRSEGAASSGVTHPGYGVVRGSLRVLG
jgi:putative protease